MVRSHPSHTVFRAPRRLSLLAIGSAAALGLSGCAGSAGGNPGGGESGGGAGFAYGASQEEVDKAIADLDPITIKYQPPAASEKSVMAPTGTVFKEIVEERSGGKITVDIIWGQAIASYAEVHDALADGRVDMAYTLPSYQPDEFPRVDALGTAMAEVEPSPMMGELVANAVGNELAWQQEELLAEYEDKGLVPLTPFAASGGYYSVCKDPLESAEDWKGKQVRIASSAQSAQVKHLAATPVSMAYPETFEALQRGTVDCTLGQLVPSAEAGLFEVAPNLNFTTTASFSRTAGAYLAGKSFKELPLAYQQIIFDSSGLSAAGGMQSVIGGNAAAIEQAKAAGGSVAAFDEAVQEEIRSYGEELTAKAAEEGLVADDISEQITSATENWEKRFEELGYQDAGRTEDFDEWFDESEDFKKYAEATYSGVPASHRPQ